MIISRLLPLVLLAASFITARADVGVGAKPIAGAEVIIDGTREMLDAKWIYWEGPRFAAVSHLLSLTHNWRVRVKVFCPDDDLPSVASVNDLWNSANWFEREAFDLFGIVFEGHPDLRRLLTDYGFVGHPFRKDFPISGHVEMRYDPEQKRVIYQPVTIEPREIVPRVIREEHYGGGR